MEHELNARDIAFKSAREQSTTTDLGFGAPLCNHSNNHKDIVHTSCLSDSI